MFYFSSWFYIRPCFMLASVCLLYLYFGLDGSVSPGAVHFQTWFYKVCLRLKEPQTKTHDPSWTQTSCWTQTHTTQYKYTFFTVASAGGPVPVLTLGWTLLNQEPLHFIFRTWLSAAPDLLLWKQSFRENQSLVSERSSSWGLFSGSQWEPKFLVSV